MQRLDRGLVVQRALELGPFALGKIQPQPHRVRYGEDIGEQDRRVQRETIQRLQRHLGGVVRALAQAEKTASALPRLTVFRQIAPRLAHHPHGCVVGWLTQQGAQEGVVLQFEVHFLYLPFTKSKIINSSHREHRGHRDISEVFSGSLRSQA
jgi:hypothetical protein